MQREKKNVGKNPEGQHLVKERNDMESPLYWLNEIANNWWVFALRGLLAIAFGLAAFLLPAFTLLMLVYIFASYCLIDGIIVTSIGIKVRKNLKYWGVLLLEGILSILTGIITFAIPALTAIVFVVIVAIWAIVTGVLKIVETIQHREHLATEWPLLLVGVVSIIFGIVLFARPALGLLTLLWTVGTFALIAGIVLIIQSFQVRSLKNLYQPAGLHRSIQ